MHTVEDYCCSPYVDLACVVFLLSADVSTKKSIKLTLLVEELGSDIGLGSTKTFTQMRLLLPAHPEDIRYTKVGNLSSALFHQFGGCDTHLDMSPTVQQQILRLDITMSNTHRMQVLDSQQDLLERTFDLSTRHATLLDSSI